MKVNLSNFFQSKLNVLIFRRFSPMICFKYMQIMGKLYYFFNKKERKLIEKNIRDVLYNHDEKYIRKTIKEAFKGIFTHYFEKMFAAFKNFPDVKKFVEDYFTIENRDILDRALAMNKGVILVTAHWGAVEFIPWVLGLKGYPLSIIVECSTEQLKKALNGKLLYRDVELISENECSSVLLKAFQCIKRNRILMTECDEVDKWRRRKKQTINLFGKNLYFDNTIDILAKKSGAPVIGAFLKRNGKNSYTLICEEISIEDPGKETAKKALHLWQKYVTMNPEQWYQWKKWNHMKAG